ncbi:MAG TPA: hypothetical protein VMD79_14500 [Solirubrobacteraceae bacterium]|nr:hypothetical protein [Solirubrobacteraceae bacterium]
MHRFKLLGVALVAVGVAVAVTAAAAFATMALPEYTVQTGWTGSSGAGKLSNTAAKSSISCTSGSNAGGAEASKKLGTFALEFKGCTAEALGSKVKCNSEGDATEVILTVGTWHLVLQVSGTGSHETLVWFLVKPTTVKCTSLVTIEVQGNVLGKIEEESKTKAALQVNVNASGGQQYTSFENDNGESVGASLVSNINKGSFSTATEESANNHIVTAKETEIIN